LVTASTRLLQSLLQSAVLPRVLIEVADRTTFLYYFSAPSDQRCFSVAYQFTECKDDFPTSYRRPPTGPNNVGQKDYATVGHFTAALSSAIPLTRVVTLFRAA
jgi:hypothetical protein